MSLSRYAFVILVSKCMSS